MPSRIETYDIDHAIESQPADARAGAGFPFGYFAFVMATGIVSLAAGLVDLAWVSRLLFFLNLVAFAGLCLWLAVRGICASATVFGPLRRHPSAGALTIVAATCVVGNELAVAGAAPVVVDGFCAVAGFLWLALIYGFVALTTIRAIKPPLESTLDGSWLLLVVATEALAIMATRAGDTNGPLPGAAFIALCLFLLGSALYAVLIGWILHRWLFLPLSADRLTAPYWINMGAAAIATLAGCRVLAAMNGVAALAPAQGPVFVLTILFWTLATWWIPLLAGLTWWRHRQGGVRLGYRLENWSMVFPLGMYTVATWRFSQLSALPPLALIPRFFVWVALAAWLLTGVGMLRSIAARRTALS